MPTAIVTGATGILGREIISALAKDSKTWQSVYALSRSQKEKYPPTVKHDHIDLTANAQTMAQQLKGVEAEYLFFAAYLQKDTEQENWDVNGAMLRNFLDALEITGASKKLKRVILTTGAKQYGVHLGEVKVPMEESDPWIDGPGRPPNFYYNQQNILKEKSKKASWDWVVTYPNDVIGVAKGNFMNLATSIGIYAAVSKEMGGKLVFPGNPDFYTLLDSFTYSRLHASFVLWAALEPRCSNEAFNVVNGEADSWENIWPKLAKYFDCNIPEDQFADSSMESKMKLAEQPPLADYASSLGLKGRTRQSEVRQHIDLVKWSQKPEVKQAWDRLAKREGLEHDALDKATWMFLGFVLGRNYNVVISMAKARRLGWNGYIDSWDSLKESFHELKQEKILPK